MTLTKDFRETVVGRVRRDPEFARALLHEALTEFLSGNAASARLILRDLVNATLGFGELAEQTHKPVKSVHRMLSDRGNPSMDNIASILEAVQSTLSSDVVIQVVKAHKRPSRSNPKRTKAALSLSDPRPS